MPKRQTITAALTLAFLSAVFLISPLEAQQEISKKSDKIPEGRTVYLGREIAQTMHYTGAPWLIRENRENEERCSLMLASLKVKTGM
ncbi:MAG: SAM-dependent methyltransferase, partial [Planctomycetaceae bacterium]|nr:SAM-dependent methyltransferase [Planctomycetaceae bacterium]